MPLFLIGMAILLIMFVENITFLEYLFIGGTKDMVVLKSP